MVLVPLSKQERSPAQADLERCNLQRGSNSVFIPSSVLR